MQGKDLSAGNRWPFDERRVLYCREKEHFTAEKKGAFYCREKNRKFMKNISENIWWFREFFVPLQRQT